MEIQPIHQKSDASLRKVNETIKQPIPQLHFVTSLIAPRGSGKTDAIINLMLNRDAWYRKFHRVYMFCPTYLNQEKLSRLKLNPERVFTECNAETFQECLDDIKAKRSDNPEHRSLIIFDDCSGSLTNTKNDPLSKLIVKHRHFGVSIVMALQYFKQLGKSCRSNMTHLLLYGLTNRSELKDVAQELGVNQDKLKRVINDLPKHEFITFDLQGGRVHSCLRPNSDVSISDLR